MLHKIDESPHDKVKRMLLWFHMGAKVNPLKHCRDVCNELRVNPHKGDQDDPKE